MKAPEERRNLCWRCGVSTGYADNLNIVSRVKTFSRRHIEKIIDTQGNRINKTLRKISLAMNRKKNQFMVAMSSQRRKASRVSPEERMERMEKLKSNIDGTIVEENDTVKTLGVRFDNFLNFRPYWEEVKKTIQKKGYAVRQLKDHLCFQDRKTLAQGLVLSRIEYCLEATSSCPKSILKLASKQLNRVAREVTNCWKYEDTKIAFQAAGWLNLEELAIWRTAKTALSIIKSKEPKRLYKRLTSDDEVKLAKKYRTAIGNRSFSARTARIWELLPDYLRSGDLTKRNIKESIKREIKKWDHDWVLWGIDKQGVKSTESIEEQANLNPNQVPNVSNTDDGKGPEENSEASKKHGTRTSGIPPSEHPMTHILIEMNEIEAEKEELRTMTKKMERNMKIN